MDTTLRDGEQTSGVSFTSSEKLSITQLLLKELLVPRVEVASARVSEGEHEAVKQICQWASENGYIDCIEIPLHPRTLLSRLRLARVGIESPTRSEISI